MQAQSDPVYQKVTPVTTEVRYAIMSDFISSVEDINVAGRLRSAISGKGAFRRFREAVDEDDGLRRRWLAYRTKRHYYLALDWLAKNGLSPEQYGINVADYDWQPSAESAEEGGPAQAASDQGQAARINSEQSEAASVGQELDASVASQGAEAAATQRASVTTQADPSLGGGMPNQSQGGAPTPAQSADASETESRLAAPHSASSDDEDVESSTSDESTQAASA